MDVARRDDDLARDLLRGYRAAGGDPGGEALLDFLCTVRALVRTKVDFLRAAQLTGAAADDRTARALALLGVAERFAWRVRLPEVLCVTGLAASGKSTVAEALAQASGRTLLSSDRTRKLRAGIDPYERAAPTAYGDGESRAVYIELARRATVAARRDGGVIVDATFRRATDADAFAATSPAAAAATWLVCEAPPAVRMERARAREFHGSVSDAGPAIVAAESATYRGPFLAPAPPLARLDTTQPLAQLLAGLADGLDARLQAGAAPSPPLHVVPDHVGGWSVLRDGSAQPLSKHDSATAAERRGRAQRPRDRNARGPRPRLLRPRSPGEAVAVERHSRPIRRPCDAEGSGKFAGCARRSRTSHRRRRAPRRTAPAARRPRPRRGCARRPRRAPAARRRRAPSDTARWKRPASECGHGSSGRTISRPRSESVQASLSAQPLQMSAFAR